MHLAPGGSGAHHGVEDCEERAHGRDERDLLGVPGRHESLRGGANHGVRSGRDEGAPGERRAHGGAAAPDEPCAVTHRGPRVLQPSQKEQRDDRVTCRQQQEPQSNGCRHPHHADVQLQERPHGFLILSSLFLELLTSVRLGQRAASNHLQRKRRDLRLPHTLLVGERRVSRRWLRRSARRLPRLPVLFEASGLRFDYTAQGNNTRLPVTWLLEIRRWASAASRSGSARSRVGLIRPARTCSSPHCRSRK